MKKSRRLATLALGLSLGLAGLGPAAHAMRNFDDDDPEVEAACSTEQSNDLDNTTGESEQSGLINVNNVAIQGLNLDLLGNLLCQGVFLNDLDIPVLSAILGDDDDDGVDDADDDGSCTTEQENDISNDTGNSVQSGGLVNVNNLAIQGLNLDLAGNALCGANFLNDLDIPVISEILGDDDDDDDAGLTSEPECSTEQENDIDNDTGTSVMGGLLNLNNIAVQGSNVAVLSNGLCGSIFLNDVLVSILGIL